MTDLQKKLRYLVFGAVSYRKEGVEDDFITVTDNLMDNLMPFIKEREEQKENELLFDLDEIDNKPWRVFRQLAAIMPHYKDTYEDYEAFYAFGGGNVVDKLIAEFKETDDYKNSYFNKEKDNV